MRDKYFKFFLLLLTSAFFSASVLAQPSLTTADMNRLLRDYAAAVHATVERHWIKPEDLDMSVRCAFIINQLPGGEVLNAKARYDCEYTEEQQESVVQALYEASPLPYRGFEYVFSRVVVLSFPAR